MAVFSPAEMGRGRRLYKSRNNHQPYRGLVIGE